MMDNDEFWYALELIDKNGSLQCYKCSGFAVYCPCEENQLSKEDKLSIDKFLKEQDDIQSNTR